MPSNPDSGSDASSESDWASSTSTDVTPSLASGSTASTSSAARTSLASIVIESNTLMEDEDGTLIMEPLAVISKHFVCIFWFLGCREEVEGLQEWDIHCQSHFNKTLPLAVRCPFKCTWTCLAETGEEAWSTRMLHILGRHHGEGVVDTESQPDGALLQHLWRHRIIDNAQMKKLRTSGSLVGEQVFKQTAGLNEDRRARKPHTAQRV